MGEEGGVPVIITYEGREYSFEVDRIDVTEWRELKRKYKMTPKQFEAGVSEADPDAMTFLYWIMLRQNGQAAPALTLGDHLKPDIVGLNNGLSEAAGDDPDEPEAEPDPTKASGSTPTSPAPPSPPVPVLAGGGSLTG